MRLEDYQDLHRASIAEPERFWLQEAARIDWSQAPTRGLDFSRPPFARWFPDGMTNLCANAVDRWAARRPEDPALIAVSTETDTERTYSFAELLAQTTAWAAAFRSLGVGVGDRVLIYMPMIAEAVFAMLACARIGAVHTVVFGGFASGALAARIDDAAPKVIVAADAGSRMGRIIPYKPLLDEALGMADHRPHKVLMVDRGLAPIHWAHHDIDARALVEANRHVEVAPVDLPSSHPSYILYTSGTTGKPKGVQRDTGGYAVALAASMEHIFFGQPGGVFFATSDIGWVVGHSYIVYGPLIAGMATILYEGAPTRPDPGVFWRLVERHRVRAMFTAPTALRLLKKEDPRHLTGYDRSSLKALFVAGEPLDEPTSRWIADSLGVPILDNYWQTETGWPILTLCRGLTDAPVKPGSPGLPVYGFDVQLVDEASGEPVPAGDKGVVAIAAPLPPGCLTTIWNDDARFVRTYFQSIPGKMLYSTFDWGVQDEEGYTFILGRTDDVINVAGHRLGTREIEEAVTTHPAVADAAVVGVHDEIKGQTPVAFVVLKDASRAGEALSQEIIQAVAREIGALAKPSSVNFVPALPKTRSGKVLRRALQAIWEGRDPGDLTTIDDETALKAVLALRRAAAKD
ncbi:MAG: propionate--CoA ligase [Caulobacteraceae bacterium]|nr:propionate--CoA ligase [Caulobacteraceae bacterium]